MTTRVLILAAVSMMSGDTIASEPGLPPAHQAASASQPGNGQPRQDADEFVSAVFAGSSPCEESIRRLLQIPLGGDAHVIEWRLTLHREAKTRSPASYHLAYQYGLTVPGQPGVGPVSKRVERRGSWRVVTGTSRDADATVYELSGSPSLAVVSDTVLHVLNPDGSLMVGNGGWSYTLYRADASEPRVDPVLAAAGWGEPRAPSPLATGPTVFGVFEGRSPCHGIARELAIEVGPSCAKTKWRLTLHQDAPGGAPTTYKVEGTLYPSTPREGRWTIVRSSGSDPNAIVYRLASSAGEPALLLLKGDDNVLFFLDRDSRLLTGHAEYSYTLNRRQSQVVEPPESLEHLEPGTP